MQKFNVFKKNLDFAERFLRAVFASVLFVLIIGGDLPSVEWKLVFTIIGFHLAMSVAMGWDPLTAIVRAIMLQFVPRFRRYFDPFGKRRHADIMS